MRSRIRSRLILELNANGRCVGTGYEPASFVQARRIFIAQVHELLRCTDELLFAIDRGETPRTGSSEVECARLAGIDSRLYLPAIAAADRGGLRLPVQIDLMDPFKINREAYRRKSA